MQVVGYHKSKLRGKLEDFEAIGNNTTKNKFCFDRWRIAKEKNRIAGKVVDICGVCYSQKSLNGYMKSNQNALDKNEVLAETLLDDFAIRQFNFLQSFFRFNHHGELLTEKVDDAGNIIKKYPKYNMIENYCRIAEYNPHCNFALWTKRTDIIKRFFDKREKPKNLIIVFSNTKVDKVITKIPKNFDKVFNNVNGDNYKEIQNCTGQKCKDCLRCYKFSSNQDGNIIVEKVK
tara:strand:+ start:768 stop:1463 length:696 start_codon:yes stop_codon:yes gene_type:complete